MINPNEPAFPVSTIDGFTVHGLTKREFFAATVLGDCLRACGHYDKAAPLAVKLADSLIAELAKEK